MSNPPKIKASAHPHNEEYCPHGDAQPSHSMMHNREDLPLLAHLQELYLFVKEYGLILNQELNPIKLTQWQKDKTLFGMDNYFEKKMGRSNSGK